MNTNNGRIKQSKVAEDNFIEFLKKNKTKYQDVRDVVKYRQMDVDFVLFMNNEQIFIDVKSDNYNHGNFNTLFIEMGTKHQYGTDELLDEYRLGCFLRTKSRYWIYYGIDEHLHIKQAWIVVISKLQEFIQTHNLEIKYTENRINWGYSIPIDILQEEGIVAKLRM